MRVYAAVPERSIAMRRKTAEERRKKNRLLTIAYSVLACVGAVFLTSVLFSGLASVIDLSDGTFTFMSSIALCAGCFAAGFTAAKRRGREGIKTGLLCGIIIFSVILPIGLIFVKGFSAGGFFTKVLIILVCSCIGGIFGVNSPRRFR